MSLEWPRNPDVSSALQQEATSASRHYLRADVTVEADRIMTVETAKRLFGRIDGVINNAGRAYRAPASKTSLEEFRSLLEINLLGAFALCQAAYEELRASRGTVVNISSVASHAVLPNRLAYGATKAALDHLTRSLAVEWGRDGIRVNGVLPWFTRTEPSTAVTSLKVYRQPIVLGASSRDYLAKMKLTRF